MKLENQVCSLEQAKRLKKLGVEQESLWYWGYVSGYQGQMVSKLKLILKGHLCNSLSDEYYSAFTVAELGDMLPEKYLSVQMEKNRGWECSHTDLTEYAEFSNTEANSRANMVIYLLENKLIEVNK